MEYTHYSVLLEESIQALQIRPDGIYVDGTLGGGGHSAAIASQLTTGKLIAVDRDERAISRASARLEPYADRVKLVHGNFRDIAGILDEMGISGVDGMLFDLGVSSPQLDEAERGFSYMTDAPLDMRMDESESLTARDVVNTWSEERLKRILYDFGEERYAPRIASAIVKSRREKPIDTTGELVEVIRSAMPAAGLREKQHPAKRTFQAIRIAVNDELAAISDMLETGIEKLNPGGRLAVISFHSLEDRIVKNAISTRENGCTCPRDFPVCTCGFVQTLKNITKKPIIPSEKELKENPRSRSAKLRVAERV
jgi:16S rRNA (cytosine1402-N4)-methyltransferase